MIELDVELWLPIPGFEGYYEASTHGRIRSVDRTVFVAAGGSKPTNYRRLTGKVLRGTPTSGGYLSVTLWVDHANHHDGVHELVALTFFGARPKQNQVCHWDGNKKNNNPGNLYYGTSKQNADDQLRHGTRAAGTRHGAAKLTEKDVADIRRLRGAVCQRALAARFGVSQSRVSRVQNGLDWRHLVVGVGPALGIDQ